MRARHAHIAHDRKPRLQGAGFRRQSLPALRAWMQGNRQKQEVRGMWPFSLLKKLTQDPPVGQPRGDYIGCYLLGTEAPGQAGVSYVSLATTREQLEADARAYLEGFVRDHPDRKSTRLNSSHLVISYAVFCLKKKNTNDAPTPASPPAPEASHP